MLTEYRDVVPLLANPKGWVTSDVKMRYNPNPVFTPQSEEELEEARQRTIKIRVPMGDTNGDKAAVRQLLLRGDRLRADIDRTEYFILWGIPGALPDLHNRALYELKPGKKTYTPIVPMGISTHNIVLLDPDGTGLSNNMSVAMIVNDSRHGFAPGRLSVSYEGQMDPTRDRIDGIPSTYATVLRTVQEEFGIGLDQSKVRVNLGDIRLVAVCAEKGSAYTSWCHIISIQGVTAEHLIESFQMAPRRRDADALLVVPVGEIDQFAQDEIQPEIWVPRKKSGSITEALLKPHPTVPWRIDVLRDHLAYLRENNARK